MWLGEKITDKGIGNGISLLIMVGIIATLPVSFAQEFDSAVNQSQGGLIMIIDRIGDLVCDHSGVCNARGHGCS